MSFLLTNMLKNFIKLKKATMRDLDENWVKWLNDKDVNKFSNKLKKKHTIKSQTKYLLELFNNKSKILYLIKYKDKNIGTILISKISKISKECEISYMIGDKNFWNRDIGTYVIRLITKIIFYKLSLNKINAGIRGDNFPSQKILIKNKFKIKKILRKNIKFGNKYFDRLIFFNIKN